MDNLDELVTWGECWLRQNIVDPPWRYTDQDLQEFGVYECYFGLCSGQAQTEIDIGEGRMGPTGAMATATSWQSLKVTTMSHVVAVVHVLKDDDHANAHGTARDSERYVSARLLSKGW